MKKTLILILAAIPTGIAVGAVDAVFGRVLLYIGEVRDAHVFWLVPFLGVVGAAMAWAYKNYGAGCESGMGMVFEAGHGEREEIPLRLIPFVMCATWLTHLFGGSAGREGVAVQLGAAISHRVGRLLRFEDAPRIMLITGMSAGFAGLFRTPFAATAFAMEVLTAGRLEHRALLPAATAALCASATSGLLGLEKFTFAVTELPDWNAELLIKLAVLGLAFGLTGAAFTYLLKKCKKEALTLSAGYQGGEVTPLFSIGASLGAAASGLIGLPAALCAAMGYAAVFGSATNTLIAPALIGAEVFGWAAAPYMLVTCALAYAVNGNGSIYSGQRKG